MFHFPRCRPPALWIQAGVAGIALRGCPIRRPTGHGPPAPRRGISPLAASFVAIRCQGIRHAPEKLGRKTCSRGRASGLPMPLREAPRRAGAGSPFCLLLPSKSISIFRFRLSKSFPEGESPWEPSGAIRAEHRPRLRHEGAASLIKGGDPAAGSPTATLLRLHPSHRPYLRRLPPSRVGPAPSGMVGSHDVTGGVYKARERIQGAVADAPLLAIPASCSRVAGCNPNWGGLSRFAGPRGPAALCTRHCSTFAAPGVGAIRT